MNFFDCDNSDHFKNTFCLMMNNLNTAHVAHLETDYLAENQTGANISFLDSATQYQYDPEFDHLLPKAFSGDNLSNIMKIAQTSADVERNNIFIASPHPWTVPCTENKSRIHTYSMLPDGMEQIQIFLHEAGHALSHKFGHHYERYSKIKDNSLDPVHLEECKAEIFSLASARVFGLPAEAMGAAALHRWNEEAGTIPSRDLKSHAILGAIAHFPKLNKMSQDDLSPEEKILLSYSFASKLAMRLTLSKKECHSHDNGSPTAKTIKIQNDLKTWCANNLDPRVALRDILVSENNEDMNREIFYQQMRDFNMAVGIDAVPNHKIAASVALNIQETMPLLPEFSKDTSALRSGMLCYANQPTNTTLKKLIETGQKTRSAAGLFDMIDICSMTDNKNQMTKESFSR